MSSHDYNLETTNTRFTGVNVKSLHFDGKLIFVDEAYNMLIGISNGSKIATALCDVLERSKNCRILGMIVTNFVNGIFKVIPALNNCKGFIRAEDGDLTTLLPGSAEGFAKYFIDEKGDPAEELGQIKGTYQGACVLQ